MKKIISLVLAIIMLAVVLTSCTSKKNEKELVIGYTLYEPMNYKNEKGELIGFDTDLAKAVCEKLGYTPKFQLIDWSNKYLELDSGNIDVIWNGFTANVTDSDGKKRSDKVDFTYAYLVNEQCVVIKASNAETLKDEASLQGKKGSAEEGSAGEGLAQGFLGESGTYIGKTSQMDTLTELKSGTVDFVVVDKVLASKVVGKGDYKDLMIVESIQIEPEVYAIGLKKGSELTEKINKALEELAADGTIMEIAERYKLEDKVIIDFKK